MIAKIPVIVFLVLITLLSGCVSQQHTSTSSTIIPNQTPQVTSSETLVPHATHSGPWYRIIFSSPNKNFRTDANYNITGSTELNITVYTEVPAGTLFEVNIVNEDTYQKVLPTVIIPVVKQTRGLNTATYTYDMKGQPPGNYVAEVFNESAGGAGQEFEIISPTTWGWIRVNPVKEPCNGRVINITGGTNIDAESEITITPKMEVTPCSPGEPFVIWGGRDLCYLTCNFKPEQRIVNVIGHANKNFNSWKLTLDTENWCRGETYWINVSISNWTNVTSGNTSFRFD